MTQHWGGLADRAVIPGFLALTEPSTSTRQTPLNPTPHLTNLPLHSICGCLCTPAIPGCYLKVLAFLGSGVGVRSRILPTQPVVLRLPCQLWGDPQGWFYQPKAILSSGDTGCRQRLPPWLPATYPLLPYSPSLRMWSPSIALGAQAGGQAGV